MNYKPPKYAPLVSNGPVARRGCRAIDLVPEYQRDGSEFFLVDAVKGTKAPASITPPWPPRDDRDGQAASLRRSCRLRNSLSLPTACRSRRQRLQALRL
jgi:hypothetical protein